MTVSRETHPADPGPQSTSTLIYFRQRHSKKRLPHTNSTQELTLWSYHTQSKTGGTAWAQHDEEASRNMNPSNQEHLRNNQKPADVTTASYGASIRCHRKMNFPKTRSIWDQSSLSKENKDETSLRRDRNERVGTSA